MKQLIFEGIPAKSNENNFFSSAPIPLALNAWSSETFAEHCKRPRKDRRGKYDPECDLAKH